MAENAANSAAGQLRSYGVGIIAGLAAVGYLQAGLLLLGPFMVVLMGISLVTVPEAARVLRRSPRHLEPYCLVVGAGLAVMALAWGAFLLVALPHGLGDLLLGSLWKPAYALVIPFTLTIMGAGFQVGAAAGLHALGAARRSLRAMIITSAISLAFSLAGAFVDGAVGAVRGGALAAWIGAVLWWWYLRAGMRESAEVPDGQRLVAPPPGRPPGQPGPDADAVARHRDPPARGARGPVRAERGGLKRPRRRSVKHEESNGGLHDRQQQSLPPRGPAASGAAPAPRVGLFGLLGSGNIGNDASLDAVLGYLRSYHPDAVLDAMCMGAEQVRARYGIDAIPLLWYQRYEQRASGSRRPG